jgi:hypothetical protein
VPVRQGEATLLQQIAKHAKIGIPAATSAATEALAGMKYFFF